MATCHPLVMLERLPKHLPTPSVPSDSFRRNTVWNFTSSVLMSLAILTHPTILSSFEFQRETLGNLSCSLSADNHMHIVLAMERFMAATTKT